MNLPIVLLTVIVDQISKAWAKKSLNYQTLCSIKFRGIYLKRMHNFGFATGIMSKDPRFVRLLAAMVLGAVLVYAWVDRHNRSKMARMGLSLIVGGGIANFIDRCLDGYVTDFITFKESGGKVYNLADFAIFKGCFLYILSEIKNG